MSSPTTATDGSRASGTASFDASAARAFLGEMYAGWPGWLQVVDSGRNFFGEAFSTDPAGLDAAVEYAAARDQQRPQGVYWRASLMSVRRPVKPDGKPGRGGAADTAAVPLLWADLDYGVVGHKGSQNPPDEDSAHGLIAAAGLPEPTILIHSGGGLYPLWQLAEAPALDDAAAMSQGIQEAIERASVARGWAYGTGVRDLARVLRLPGSINRKTNMGRPCRVIGGSGTKVSAGHFPRPTPRAPAARPVTARPLSPRTGRSKGGRLRGGPGVLDGLDQHATWADILEPAGWTFVGTDGDDWQRWLRPGGADSEYSARAFEHNLVCHSESAGLPSGAGQRLTKARVCAWLWFGSGDTSEVARAILRGDSPLPPEVAQAVAATVAPTRIGATTAPAGPVVRASDEALEAWLATYTSATKPGRLVHRVQWLQHDGPARHPRHALALVEGSIAGHWSARQVVAVLRDATGRRSDLVHTLLADALGALLSPAEARS